MAALLSPFRRSTAGSSAGSLPPTPTKGTPKRSRRGTLSKIGDAFVRSTPEAKPRRAGSPDSLDDDRWSFCSIPIVEGTTAAERATTFDILTNIVSHLAHDKEQLVILLQTSRRFYHIAGKHLYSRVDCDLSSMTSDILSSTPLGGFTRNPEHPYSKASLLASTRVFTLAEHQRSECHYLSGFDSPGHSGPQGSVHPLKLPRLHELVIRVGASHECTGIDCPLTRELEPTMLTLIHPWTHRTHLASLPSNLNANLTELYLELGLDGVSHLKRAMKLLKASKLDKITYIQLSLQLKTYTVNTLVLRDLTRFRKACTSLLANLTRSNVRFTFALKVKRQTDTNTCDLSNCPDCWMWRKMEFIWNEVALGDTVAEEVKQRVSLEFFGWWREPLRDVEAFDV